jgi:hypothetical protein
VIGWGGWRLRLTSDARSFFVLVVTNQPLPSPAPSRSAEEIAADAAFYRGVLHGLIVVGADLAQVVQEQARHPVAPEPIAELAEAFERIARAVRRTVALARTLDEPVKARALRAAGAGHAAARARIRREVEEVIELGTEASEAEELREQLRDRMERPEFEDELGDRPIEEIIAGLFKDLRLAAQAAAMRGPAPRGRGLAARAIRPLAQWSDAELDACEADWNAREAARAARWRGSG